MKIAKQGDKIEWTFNNEIFTANVVITDNIEKHYCVFAKYGPDKIPFEMAKIIKERIKK